MLARFRTPATSADEAAGLLVAGGALGCAVAEMSRPGRPTRKLVTLEAFFDHASRRAISRLHETLKAAGMIAGDRDGEIRSISDPGWATMWQKRFKPFRIGSSFLIVPPWERRTEPNRSSIVIKPGRAFGTGHHPSTAGALRAIDAIARNGRRMRSALDVGTGSGVLAIALKKVGAERIIALDVDADALENARANADLNGVGRSIRFSAIPLASVRGRFDVIAANILAGVLIEIAPALISRVAAGGSLVLGGILSSEARQVIAAYRGALRFEGEARSRGWSTLSFTR